MTEFITTYVQNRIDDELPKKFSAQENIVRELADRAEDIIWKRFYRYAAIISFFSAILIAIFIFSVGKTYKELFDDVKQSVERAMEPALSEAKEKARQADTVASDAFATAQRIKGSVEKLSDDVNMQVSAANNIISTTSHEVSALSANQIFPGLGKEKYVTLDGQFWDQYKTKKPDDKWVNVYVETRSLGDYTQDQLIAISDNLKASGYTPILGFFGIGGPYSGGFGALEETTCRTATVLYFSKPMDKSAEALAGIVSGILRKSVKAQFVDTAAISSADLKFVIAESGVDFQLCLGSPF